MDNSPTGKRQKLSSREEEEMTAATPSNADAMPDEIVMKVLSFVLVDDLFPDVCVVSKNIHQECLKLLDAHCQEHHPTLMLMEQVHSNRNPSSSIKKRWLTYPQYRLFRDSKECGIFLGREHWPIDRNSLVEDGEMILEISTPTGVLLAHDIQRLDRDGEGCRFAINNFPGSGKDMRTGDVNKLDLRVRVLVRRISTGEIVFVMNQSAPLSTIQVPVELQGDANKGEANRSGFNFYYSGDRLSSDPTFLRARVSFNRYRNSNGEIAFVTYRGESVIALL